MRVIADKSTKGQRFGGALPALALALALLGAVLASIALAAPQAWAADYRCSQMDTTAQVETDGSLTVTDQRTFEFMAEDEAEDVAEDEPEGVADIPRQTLKWLYDGFDEDAEITVKRVRMAAVDAEGNVSGEWRKLKPVTFLLPWRDGGGPEKDAWSYDKYRSTLYAFIDSAADRVVFEVTYVVHHAIVAYDDAADFSWEYAPRDYPVALHNITAEVVLPVPAGESVTPGDNVRAWGHGPADGTVDIGKDGSVTFFDPEVASDVYAMGRVMFPVQWLVNLPEADRLANQGTLQYEPTTRYEEGWVDSEAYQRLMRMGLSGGLLALCALALAAGVLAYVRWGRQKAPRFTDNYTNCVPAPAMAPAIMGRLWRWNHISSDDVVATVVDMVRRGAVGVRPSLDDVCADGEDATLVFEPWSPDDAALAEANRERPLAQEVGVSVETAFEEGINDAGEMHGGRTALDEPTRRLLTLVSQGAPSVSVEQLSSFAHYNPGALLRAMDAWQQALTAQVEPLEFFDRRSRRVQRLMLVVVVVLVVLAVAAWFVLGWLPAVLTLASAAALGVLANYTARRSPEGNEITAHAKALRNWIRDGGAREGCGTVRPPAEDGLEDRETPRAGEEAMRETLTAEEDLLVPYALLFGVLPSMPPTPLAVFAQRLSDVAEEALRSASRRAEVAGSTGEAPADKAVEPHWRPFWRRGTVSEEAIDDDF